MQSEIDSGWDGHESCFFLEIKGQLTWHRPDDLCLRVHSLDSDGGSSLSMRGREELDPFLQGGNCPE